MMIMKRKSKSQMTTMSIENIIICVIIGSTFPLQTTSTPIEIAQVVGGTVSLNCPKRSSDGIKWTFNKDNEDAIYFYENGTFKGDQFKDRSRFDNDPATGKEILKISDIKPGDAGLYKCLTAGSTETTLQSTQLTVLDSKPTCDSNSKDNEFVGPNTCELSQDEMRFSCAVSYHGTKAPRLQWEDVKNNQILKECNESQPNRINCTLALKAEPEYDGSVFRCKAVMLHGEQYNCSTKAVKVLYFILKNDSKSSETIKDKIKNLARSNQELRLICTLQEDNEKIVDVHSTRNVKFYNCTYSYNIKNTNCLAVVSDVSSPYRELSSSLKSLAIVNGLVLVVFAVVSYFFIEYEHVTITLENINEIFVTWSKIVLLVFAVLDFAVLMFTLTIPTENLLSMKCAQTVILLFLTFVEAIFLLLWQCKCKVPSWIVKLIPGILCLVALSDVGFLIAGAFIVTEELRRSSHGMIDEWAIGFILVLVFYACFALVAVAIAKCCYKMKKNDSKANHKQTGPTISGRNPEASKPDETYALQG